MNNEKMYKSIYSELNLEGEKGEIDILKLEILKLLEGCVDLKKIKLMFVYILNIL